MTKMSAAPATKATRSHIPSRRIATRHESRSDINRHPSLSSLKSESMKSRHGEGDKPPLCSHSMLPVSSTVRILEESQIEICTVLVPIQSILGLSINGTGLE